MKNAWVIVLFLALCGCGGRANSPGSQKATDTTIKHISVTITKTDANNALDSGNVGPSANEVIQQSIASYKKIKRLDTVIVDGNDSLKAHLEHYCLHDSTLIIPPKYNWWDKGRKNFTTHNFASKLILVKNRDTVFKHIILKSWFNKGIDESLKKYGTITQADFVYYDKKAKNLVFSFTIEVPRTDVGHGVNLFMDKNGGYEVNTKTLPLYH